MTLRGNWLAPLLYQVTIPARPDSDGDGIPDAWEMAYFGTTNRDGTADFDGDGFTDYQEYIADTNPTNALLYLHFTAMESVPGGVRIEWQGGILATQYLQRLDDLGTNTWQDIYTNYHPQVTESYTDPGTNRMPFLRIKATR